MKQYYLKNREKYIGQSRRWKKEHRDYKLGYDRQYYKDNMEKHILLQKRLRHERRVKLLSIIANGGKICCCLCGYDNILALQKDHINGGGNLDKKRFHNNDGMERYYAVHPEEARKTFRILCANCNTIKYRVNEESGRKFLNPLNIKSFLER